MNDFVFQSPTKFVFGRGYVDRTGAEVKALNAKRVLLVCGGSSARSTGVLQRVEKSLADAGIKFLELGGVRPNPEVKFVRQGIDLARDNRIDLILAVGGGSAIDCAKAISFGVPSNRDVWDFFEGRARIKKALPVVAVLTIPAAGSEASGSCVISNDALQLKCGVNGDVFRPRVAIMDPEVTFTLPPYQTAAGVTDMICHICERYFSGTGSVPVTDGICTSLIRSVMDAARTVMQAPDDYDARATIMWVGTLAHNDLCGCGRATAPQKRAGGWESHGLEHEISAHNPEVTHGAGLAVILPAWMRHVWRAHPERFLAFARDVFGVEPADQTEEAVAQAVTRGIDELQGFFVQMGMPRTLDDLDCGRDEIDAWLRTLRRNKGERFGEFMPLTMDDARAIYESAF